MKHGLKRLIGIGLALTLSIGPVAQTALATAAAEKVSNKNSAIIALDREPDSLDPSGQNVAVARLIERNIYDTLLRFDEKMKPVAGLAEKWEKVDALTWKFTLRKNVKFHNGDTLTSKDVLFSFQRMYDIATGNESVVEIDKNGFQTPDDNTFILKTKREYSSLEPLLCSPALGIVSEKAVKSAANPAAFGRNPVGTGPFKFVSWTAGDKIVVERNDNYWDTNKAKLKTLTFRVITETATRTIELESGGIDVNLALSANDATRIDKNKNTSLIKHPNVTLRYIAMNTQKAALKDKLVRQALFHATDTESIRKIVYGEFESVQPNTMVPPGLPGRNESLVPYKYDTKLASDLLTKAGVTKPIDLQFLYLAGSQNDMLAQLVQDMWKKVNVNLILKPMESAALTAALNKGEHDICSAGTSFALSDPGEGLNRFFHTKYMNTSADRSNLSVPTIDELLDKIQVTANQADRNGLIIDAQMFIHDQAPLIYLAFPLTLVGTNAKLRDFPKDSNGYYDLRKIYFVD